MRKSILFFSGTFITVFVIAMLVAVAAIYYSVDKSTIEAFFLQPGRTVDRRPGTPESIAEFDPKELQNMLIERFISEYFSVSPDKNELEARKQGKTVLKLMSLKDVFSDWYSDVAPELSDLSEAGVLRQVKLISAEPDLVSAEPDQLPYWYVKYQMKTWYKPNNLSEIPKITEGIIYMRFDFKPKMKIFSSTMTAERYLESGRDPAGVFYFYVGDVPKEIKQE